MLLSDAQRVRHGETRKIAAILVADVVGYSRLAGMNAILLAQALGANIPGLQHRSSTTMPYRPAGKSGSGKRRRLADARATTSRLR